MLKLELSSWEQMGMKQGEYWKGSNLKDKNLLESVWNSQKELCRENWHTLIRVPLFFIYMEDIQNNNNLKLKF